MAEKVSPLQESPGVESIKRWMGCVLCSAGVAQFSGLWWVSIWGPKPLDPTTATVCASTLLWAGVSLLGATVLEGIGSGIGKRLGGA